MYTSQELSLDTSACSNWNVQGVVHVIISKHKFEITHTVCQLYSLCFTSGNPGML